VEWNQRLNLTTIADYREVQSRHFVDSLSVALALGPGAGRVTDIGTGAGFRGLPLKILLPHLQVVLL
jgi:16S rRNA (guanine527-N7)-methyltransferase